jgi:hypothetical protein
MMMGDDAIPAHLSPAVAHRYFRAQHLVGVGVVDPHRGVGLGGFDELLVDGERPHPRRDVAAVAHVADQVALDVDLPEGVVHVGVVAIRNPDDRHLRRDWP